MKLRISIITLGVQDLDQAIAFYRDGLGFPLRPGEQGIAFFELNGTWLGLFPWDQLAEDATVEHAGSGFRGVTLAHNVASEAEVLEVLQQAEDAGATIVKPAQKVFWGGFSGYFKDLDGHLWEVAHNPFFWAGPKDEE